MAVILVRLKGVDVFYSQKKRNNTRRERERRNRSKERKKKEREFTTSTTTAKTTLAIQNKNPQNSHQKARPKIIPYTPINVSREQPTKHQ